MEVVTIERHLFETLISRFETFTRKAEAICRKYADKQEWLDNRDVCLLLDISPRTLQSLRDTGRLPSTRFERKTFYRPQDVKKLIKRS